MIEWTAQRLRVMKRNAAIVGRNRFIEQFNAMFGACRPLLPLEPLPESHCRTAEPGKTGHREPEKTSDGESCYGKITARNL